MDNLHNMYAVIDIGTRAGRMVIIQKKSYSEYDTLYKMSDLLSIGLSIKNNLIDLESKHIVKLRYFLIKAIEQIKSYNIPKENIRIIGTEAFRKAHNLKLVLHDMYVKTKAHIKVLSPYEEATFALHSAFDSLMASNSRNNLIIDTGGGSVELILVQMDESNNITYKDWVSISVGIMLPKIRGNAKYVSFHIRNMINYQIMDFYKRNMKYYPVNIIGIKSSLFQIASKILKKKSVPYNQKFTHDEIIDNMNDIYNEMVSMHIESINDIINIRSIAILKTILDMFDFNNVYISNHGLLHGIIKDLINQVQ